MFCVHFQTSGHCPKHEVGKCKYNHDLSSTKKAKVKKHRKGQLCVKFLKTLVCEEFQAGTCPYNHDTAKATAKIQKQEAKR